MKSLDFIIIGAQKSGTTSLFEYLRRHPQIYMPPEKEIPFFTDDNLYQAGWDSFAKKYFASGDISKQWGKASPQYMGDLQAAQRIYETMPHIRLIALLRNPIYRTYSHYLMSYRRELETRSFAQVLTDSLEPKTLELARQAPVPDYAQGYAQADPSVNQFYIVWSEYYRILQVFLQYIPKEDLLILFTEDLQNQAEATVKQCLEFLHVDHNIIPDNIKKIYHKGGKKPFIPETLRRKIMSIKLIYKLWSYVPDKTQAYIRSIYEKANIKPHQKQETLSSQEKEILIQYFKPQVDQLNQLIGKPAPWPEFLA